MNMKNVWSDEPGWTDIGGGHRIRFTSWSPDRELNPQLAEIPDIERCGLLDEHVSKGGWDEGQVHVGSIMFDLPEVRAAFGNRERPYWQLESWDPLTIFPSLLCGCGDHGFIREGRWVAC